MVTVGTYGGPRTTSNTLRFVSVILYTPKPHPLTHSVWARFFLGFVILHCQDHTHLGRLEVEVGPTPPPMPRLLPKKLPGSLMIRDYENPSTSLNKAGVFSGRLFLGEKKREKMEGWAPEIAMNPGSLKHLFKTQKPNGSKNEGFFVSPKNMGEISPVPSTFGQKSHLLCFQAHKALQRIAELRWSKISQTS